MAQATTVDGGRALPASGLPRRSVALAAALVIGLAIGLMVARGPAEVAAESGGSGTTSQVTIDFKDDYATRHLPQSQIAWKDDFITRRYAPQG